MDVKKASGVFLSPAQQGFISELEVVRTNLSKAKMGGAGLMSLQAALPMLPKAEGGEAKGEQLKPWLLNELRVDGKLQADARIYFGDQDFYLPTSAEILLIHESAKLDKLVGKLERFDCDDFAFAFKGHSSCYAQIRDDWGINGLCVGFVSGSFTWSGPGHAANLYVDYAGGQPKVRFIEPSNGHDAGLDECTTIKALFI